MTLLHSSGLDCFPYVKYMLPARRLELLLRNVMCLTIVDLYLVQMESHQFLAKTITLKFLSPKVGIIGIEAGKSHTAQQSVHLTGGILRHFRALSTPKQNPALEVLSTPAHPQVTPTVYVSTL